MDVFYEGRDACFSVIWFANKGMARAQIQWFLLNKCIHPFFVRDYWIGGEGFRLKSGYLGAILLIILSSKMSQLQTVTFTLPLRGLFWREVLIFFS
jgi:hypothetical protein